MHIVTQPNSTYGSLKPNQSTSLTFQFEETGDGNLSEGESDGQMMLQVGSYPVLNIGGEFVNNPYTGLVFQGGVDCNMRFWSGAQ